MDDEHLSLYEAVDYEEVSGPPKPPAVGQQHKYQVLNNAAAQKLNNYDQLNVCSSESDIKHELKRIKKYLKCLKVVAIIGLLMAICLAIATAVAIDLALHRTSVELSSQPDNNLLNMFRNCFNESQSCYIKDEVNNRLVCNTETLPLGRKVSELN